MGSFIGLVVLNASDSQRATAFWQQALGYVAQPTSPEFLVPPERLPPSSTRQDHGDGVHLHVDSGDQPHLDLWADRGDSLESEVERLVALGARRVEWTAPPLGLRAGRSSYLSADRTNIGIIRRRV